MKTVKLLSLVAIMALSATAVSAKNKTHKYIVKKTSWRYILDNKYMSCGEVTNLEYKEFLFHLKEAGKIDEYNKYKVDSSRWEEALSYNEPMIKYYHSHLSFQHYPVVNISHEAAVAYCKWLTDFYNSGKHGLKHFYKKVEVRLPTKEEWTKAARGGRPYSIYPWGGSYCRNSRGCFLANFKSIPEENLQEEDSTTFKLDKIGAIAAIDDKPFITVPVTSYFPNDYGLYNTSGNVAEMLAEPGTTKGGSWNTTAYYMRLDVDADPYAGWEKPSPYIGFRPIMDIIEQ